MEKQNMNDFLKELNKKYGDNTMIKVGDQEIPKIKMKRTGITSFDLALGGGFGEGRIVELFGMESSGKTTLSLLAIAEEQKLGHKCAFIDVEQALDFEYAAFLGVNIPELYVTQPDSAEDALEILDRSIESGLFSIIVLDSVAALAPKAELEGEMGDQKMAVVARLMSQATRKITAKTKKTNTTVIFINQMRAMIGAYVPMNVTTGGNALKFAASQRVEVGKGTQIKSGDDILGYLMKIKVVKNKLFPPFKKAEVDNIFGVGIDRFKDSISVAVDKGIIQKSGSWYSYDGVKLGQGLDKAKDLIADNPEMMEEITEKLIKATTRA